MNKGELFHSIWLIMLAYQNGAQTVGRKTSWAKDVWANYFWGDRRLGDKLGPYGDSKLDGWATFFRRLGEMCERGETQNYTIIRQMYVPAWLEIKPCAKHWEIRAENWGPDGKNFNPNTQTHRKSIPTETRYLAQKTVWTLLKCGLYRRTRNSI